MTSAFYTALQEGGQVELPRHTDGGDISFMIALSGSNDYAGAHILKSTRPLRFSEFKGLG